MIKTFIPFSKLMSEGRNKNHVFAIRSDKTEVFWEEFKNDVGRACQKLKISKELRYILACEDIYYFLVALMALLHSDKEIIISPNLQPGKLRIIANKCDGLILDDQQISLLIFSDSEKYTFHKINTDKAKIIIYTSGSTGDAVPVTKSVRALEAEILAFNQLWGERIHNSIFVSSVTHYHSYGLALQIIWPLSSGDPILLNRISYPDDLLMYRQNYTVNFISSPTFLSRYVKVIDGSVDFLNMVTSAGAPISIETSKIIASLFSEPIVELYGSTETGVIASRTSFEGGAWSCLPGVAIKKNDDGTLLVRTPFSELDDYQEVPDYVKILENGDFSLHGRADKIVKIYEKRVSLMELEKLCQELTWVSIAKAIVLNDDERLGCVIELNKEGLELLQKKGRLVLIEMLREHLHFSMDLILLPRKWRFVEILPYNDMGKLIREEILSLFERTDRS